jgi:hypothetical protein
LGAPTFFLEADDGFLDALELFLSAFKFNPILLSNPLRFDDLGLQLADAFL